MSVIIQEVTAEAQGALPAAPQPATPPGAAPTQPVSFDRLRLEMRRDAQRRARLWAD